MQKAARLKREIQMLQQSPPPGVSCCQDEKDKDVLRAQIVGSEGTPYHGGVFCLAVTIPERYPFEPPKVIFETPIYHPNIDSGGRICLDTLKMPPQGAWKPSLNVGSVLTTIQLLMSEANPDDPLMVEISSEYKCNRHLFNENAKKWTRKYAMSHLKSCHTKISRESCEMASSSDSSDDEPHCSGFGSNARKRVSSDSDVQLSRTKRFQGDGVDG